MKNFPHFLKHSKMILYGLLYYEGYCYQQIHLYGLLPNVKSQNQQVYYSLTIHLYRFEFESLNESKLVKL